MVERKFTGDPIDIRWQYGPWAHSDSDDGQTDEIEAETETEAMSESDLQKTETETEENSVLNDNGETIGGTSPDDLHDEKTRLLPNGVEEDELSDRTKEILEQSALNPFADCEGIAELTGCSVWRVESALREHYPDHDAVDEDVLGKFESHPSEAAEVDSGELNSSEEKATDETSLSSDDRESGADSSLITVKGLPDNRKQVVEAALSMPDAYQYEIAEEADCIGSFVSKTLSKTGVPHPSRDECTSAEFDAWVAKHVDDERTVTFVEAGAGDYFDAVSVSSDDSVTAEIESVNDSSSSSGLSEFEKNVIELAVENPDGSQTEFAEELGEDHSIYISQALQEYDVPHSSRQGYLGKEFDEWVDVVVDDDGEIDWDAVESGVEIGRSNFSVFEERVIELAVENPDGSQTEIAEELDVHSAHVSDALEKNCVPHPSRRDCYAVEFDEWVEEMVDEDGSIDWDAIAESGTDSVVDPDTFSSEEYDSEESSSESETETESEDLDEADDTICSGCGKEFKNVGGRLSHEQYCDEAKLEFDEVDLVCPKCEETFKHPSGRAYHEEVCDGLADGSTGEVDDGPTEISLDEFEEWKLSEDDLPDDELLEDELLEDELLEDELLEDELPDDEMVDESDDGETDSVMFGEVDWDRMAVQHESQQVVSKLETFLEDMIEMAERERESSVSTTIEAHASSKLAAFETVAAYLDNLQEDASR